MRSLSFAALASVAALTLAAPFAHAQADPNAQPGTMPSAGGMMMGGSYTRDMMMARNDSTGANSAAAIAMSDPQFTTLTRLVRASGLAYSLLYRGPLTVFAPTNDAFDKLPPGTVDALLMPENLKVLQNILMYHIVPGGYTAADVTALNGQMLPTTARMTPLSIVAGPAISYGGGSMESSSSGGGSMPNSPAMGTARITRPDIMVSNGVVHVIDTVLLPPMDAMTQADLMKSAKRARMMTGKMKTPTLVDQAAMAQKTPAELNKEKPLGGSAQEAPVAPAGAKP